jgi:hypothetical protein
MPHIISIVTRRAWISRAVPRLETDVLGRLTNDNEMSIGCLVEDISLCGARVCAAERLLAGEQLWLSVPEFEIALLATVVWSTPEGAGLAFLRSRVKRRHVPKSFNAPPTDISKELAVILRRAHLDEG